jgi:hypothetical protein
LRLQVVMPGCRRAVTHRLAVWRCTASAPVLRCFSEHPQAWRQLHTQPFCMQCDDLSLPAIPCLFLHFFSRACQRLRCTAGTWPTNMVFPPPCACCCVHCPLLPLQACLRLRCTTVTWRTRQAQQVHHTCCHQPPGSSWHSYAPQVGAQQGDRLQQDTWLRTYLHALIRTSGVGSMVPGCSSSTHGSAAVHADFSGFLLLLSAQ